MERLFEILSYRRNYETSSEHDFLRNVIAKIPNIKFDTELNAYVRIGEPHESETMFSCHTDTVHWPHDDPKSKTILPNVGPPM